IEPLVRAEKEAAENADLRVCGIALNGDAERVRAFCVQHKLAGPQACPGLAESAALRGRWGIDALPLVLEIDEQGRIVSVTDAKRSGAPLTPPPDKRRLPWI